MKESVMAKFMDEVECKEIVVVKEQRFIPKGKSNDISNMAEVRPVHINLLKTRDLKEKVLYIWPTVGDKQSGLFYVHAE